MRTKTEDFPHTREAARAAFNSGQITVFKFREVMRDLGVNGRLLEHETITNWPPQEQPEKPCQNKDI